jgi:hypothetical protein
LSIFTLRAEHIQNKIHELHSRLAVHDFGGLKVSDDSRFDHPFNAEAIAAALAHAAMEQGDTTSVAALAVSTPRSEATGYMDDKGNVWNGYFSNCITLLTFYLEVPIASFGKFYRVREEVQNNLSEILSPIIMSYPQYRVDQARIVPATKAPDNWQQNALAWLSGEGVNNQGRVRSDNIAAIEHDRLFFRSEEEIKLYRALKAQGVTFAPLPVFVRGGSTYRRIEPDFVIIRNGVVVVVEVDGNHPESPLEAHERTTMLVHEGAHVERVKASDCSTMEGAEVCAKRIVGVLGKIKASR